MGLMILSPKYSSSPIMIPRRRRLQGVVTGIVVQNNVELSVVVVSVERVDVMVMVSGGKKSRSLMTTSPDIWLG